MEENPMTKNEAMDKPWYKRKAMLPVLIILGLIVAVGLVFAGFFTYYALQIKYGDAGKLAKQFVGGGEKMSINQFLSGAEKSGDFVSDYVKYIREYNPTSGNKNARVTILAFIDFECPYCREEFPIFQEVMRKYEPITQAVFKYLPLVSDHPNALTAAEAAACAWEQGKFWEYHNLLFTKPDLNKEALSENGMALGLNMDMFNLCLATEKYAAEINRDTSDAVEIGLRGTPSYLVNGVKIEGVLSAEQWDEVILGFLNKAQ